MNQEEQFDALQNRLVTLLFDCEEARHKSSKEGPAYYHAAVMVGVAVKMAFDALRLLRNEAMQQFPAFTKNNFAELMAHAEQVASEKNIPAATVLKSLIVASEAVCEQAEANLKQANYTMINHEQGIGKKEF